ncbi:MAG: vitamin B12-dependent ribonucleotide reductase [Spirochaetes bacterium]|jgi:ribonucleoside-diphosphate reductase alpha chain|nr:vitamin B12-dependent ribonucleotide reductase [Spirochaetota bacterium]
MDWKDIVVSSKKNPSLSKNSLIVMEKRYLAKDDRGEVAETPRGLFERVARFVASADLAYGRSAEEVSRTADEFYEMMCDLQFIPNTPTLMNAGRPLGQLSACFVLPVEDSMDRIFDSVKHMALIHKSGGGTGFSFSRLRPNSDMVKTTAGVSSGPVSFMNIFNAATETIKQGGTRRGANMAILRVDHPDIIEFVTAKEDTSALTNFNISVAVTDEFMKALEDGGDYPLVNPRTGETVKMMNAVDVFDLIVDKAWLNGEPGIIFIDRINDRNPLKKIGLIESTNPCGEQPLLPYESCNLGSINLNCVVSGNGGGLRIDYDRLKGLARKAVHFLDNIIDLNQYPLPEIRETTLANRKIGLGVMGFADLLIRLGISYDSEEAVKTAVNIMSAIQDEARDASRALAAERGPFPNYARSSYAEEGGKPLRNATTTTIAPTGTISIIANSSSGIEPIFALAYVRNVMDNNVLVETNPLFEKTARDGGFFSEEIMEKVAEHGSASGIEGIPENYRKVFVTSHDILPEWHVRIQAAFQKFTDNAVSKTVNFPNSATRDDIRKVYSLAYELECKGVTVYRDGSRDSQVLEKSSTRKARDANDAADEIESHHRPRPRREVTWGATRKMITGCGALYVTINEDKEGLFEVFATMGKSGGCAASQTESVSRLISLALRSGIDKEQVIKQLKGVRCPNQAWEKGGRVYSCADAIAKAMERHEGINFVIDGNDRQEMAKNSAEIDGKGSDKVMVGVCPDCHGPLEFESGCSVCRSCGFSRCG